MERGVHKRLTAAMNALPNDLQDSILGLAEDCVAALKEGVCAGCLYRGLVCDLTSDGCEGCTCHSDPQASDTPTAEGEYRDGS